VKLFDLDHLNALVNHNIAEREALIADAEQVVFEILDEFQAWKRALSTRSTIVGLRNKLDSIRKEQVCKSAFRSHEVNQSLDQFSAQLLNRILHEPTVQLKAVAAKSINNGHEEAIRRLFRLPS
jgi:glutamyl-tRNA reductase